jgi:hypothetical protein
MPVFRKARHLIPPRQIRAVAAIAAIGVLMLHLALAPTFAAQTAKPPVKLAVFDFELEDVSPGASYASVTNGNAATMEKVSSAARQVLAQSGRYSLMDVSKVDAKPVRDKSLRNCGGCEAAIALQLGAEQSLIGIVTRATQTDYYVTVVIRDARSGKALDQQSANFAGGDDGWASGARMLIRHQVLASVE